MPKLRTTDSEKIREHCIDREPFETHGNMWGDRVNYTSNRVGRLPIEYHWSYLGSEYAIYSYNTPIAWYGPDGWNMPDVKYSQTTSAKHQSRLWFIKDWIKQQSED